MLTQTDIHQDESGIAIVKFGAALTLGNSMSVAESKIRQLIETDGARKIIFDLTEVEYADSAGLGLLVYMHGRLQELGGQLRLAAPRLRLRELFKMTRTEDLLQIDSDVQTSMEKLKA